MEHESVESLRRWLREREDEIARLRRMNADLLTAKHVEIVSPPIPEGFVIQELQKANVALHADIARLRSGTRCPHCDELRLELGQARRELARLSGLLREGVQYPGSTQWLQRAKELVGNE